MFGISYKSLVDIGLIELLQAPRFFGSLIPQTFEASGMSFRVSRGGGNKGSPKSRRRISCVSVLIVLWQWDMFNDFNSRASFAFGAEHVICS